MKSWTAAKLVDVVTLQRGHDLPASVREEGSVPVVGSFGVTGYHSEARYKGPCVAIGRSGASIGVATYCAEDYWPLNTCLFVKDFHGNVPRWIYYLLDSIDFSGFNSGSAQPSLNRNFLAQIPVALPSVAEQRAISATLGAIDDKIASNGCVVNKASELLDAMAAHAASDLPVVPLDMLASLNRRTVDPSLLGETIVHHFSLPAFDEGALPEEVAASQIKSNKTRVRCPSVLVSRLNPRIDRAWWATPDPTVPALASPEFACLEGVAGVDLAAVWLAVRDPAFRTELIHRVTGTSGSHQRVRPDDLLAIEVMDARLLSIEMTASASALLALIGQARVENRKLTALRDALLPELLSGRIRVGDLARESTGLAGHIRTGV